jgi:hypothetical protein
MSDRDGSQRERGATGAVDLAPAPGRPAEERG